jgi:chromosome partitioning protein
MRMLSDQYQNFAAVSASSPEIDQADVTLAEYGQPGRQPVCSGRVIRRVATSTGDSYMAHSIITVATMKGGSGKSTLASCLAVHWQLKGSRSAIIDNDPQRTIARLATREKALGGVQVTEDATDEAFKAAQRLVGDYEKVIIDTPGFRSQATLACLGVSDFVLVPVKPSPFDVDRMLDTLNILINGVSGRKPIFRCVLTQTTRESVIAKHIRSELAEAGFPVLDSEMTNRVVYAEAALWGGTPSLIDKSGPAAREIAAIADEVEQICESMIQVKRAASA